MMSVAGYINNGFFVDAVSLTGAGGAALSPVAPQGAATGGASIPPASQTGGGGALSAAEITLANAVTYTVKPGDSIFKIAKAVGVPALAIINANSLSDPTLIRPGQTLIIPDPDKFYTVQRGDTLSQLAQRFGTTTAVLQAINNLRSTSIYTGQIIVVP
jgi:LysM repeat protein